MLNLITNARLVKRYGTHEDGIYIWKGEKRIGFISDLRQEFLKELKDSNKESSGPFRRATPKPYRRNQANSFGPDGENKL